MRQQQRRSNQQDRMLPRPVEQQGRNNRAEKAANHSADRHHQVEFGQARSIGPGTVHFGVQRHRYHKQQADTDAQPGIGGLAPDHEHRSPAEDQHRGRNLADDIGQEAVVGKRDRKAEQIEPERDHPDQRHRHQVGGEMRGGRQHQPRRHRRQCDPVKPLPPSDRGCAFGCCIRRCLCVAARPDRACANQHEQEERGVKPAPHPGLRGGRQVGLDEQRIGDQPAKAAQVGGGVERIRLPRIACEAEPALHQRCLRRDREEERAYRREQQPRHPEYR